MPNDKTFTPHMMVLCQILDYKIEMTLSAFRTLVLIEQAHLRVYTNDRYHGLCFPTMIQLVSLLTAQRYGCTLFSRLLKYGAKSGAHYYVRPFVRPFACPSISTSASTHGQANYSQTARAKVFSLYLDLCSGRSDNALCEAKTGQNKFSPPSFVSIDVMLNC